MIELASVSIRAGEFLLTDISFRVQSGSYTAIMGRTGIGKTTILEAICGLRSVEKGTVCINGSNVTSLPPGDRNLGYVPQDLALFPTMTVEQQLEFAMTLRRISSSERKRRTQELAERLSITHLLKRRPVGLSGGEAQRVALGRALSFQPAGLLLDEPLSALDVATRHAAQNLLKTLSTETGVTVIHVTHNAAEAAALADECLILQRDDATGKIALVRESN